MKTSRSCEGEAEIGVAVEVYFACQLKTLYQGGGVQWNYAKLKKIITLPCSSIELRLSVVALWLIHVGNAPLGLVSKTVSSGQSG